MATATAILRANDIAAQKRAEDLRPPWAVSVIALLSLISVGLTRRGALVPTALTLAFAASFIFSARLAARSLRCWLLRLGTYICVLVAVLSDPPATIGAAATAGHFIDLLMRLCMAELIVQYWQVPKRHLPGAGRPNGALLILLSGFVFVAASRTFERRILPYFTPLYVIALIFALHSVRARAVTFVAPRTRWMRPLLIVLMLSIGFSTAALISRYKKLLSRTGLEIELTAGFQGASKVVGFTNSPSLGEVQNATRSMTRVLRIDGRCPDPHLRGMIYADYINGRWEPPAASRAYEALASGELNLDPNGPRTHFTRLTDDLELLFLPLHCAGLHLTQRGSLQRDTDGGAALLFQSPAPVEYAVILSETSRFQGPFCVPPSAGHLEHCLNVPDSIKPAVIDLANTIARGEKSAMSRVLAVEHFLQNNYSYSLVTDPGRGDPISNFILNKNAAHCEFFASAAVMLLRCMKVPARYVSGFYAHESASGGKKIVRSQDAHAWAEAWVEGVGWMTLDGTPATGRPDVLADEPPMWRRAWEWTVDVATAAMQIVYGLNVWEDAALAALALLLGVAMFRRQRRVARVKLAAVEHRSEYTQPSGALPAIAARFDAVLRRRELPCPPHLTWQEHVALLTPGNAGSKGLDLEKARDFLIQYNALRFGNSENADAAARLRGLIDVLERRPGL